MGLWAKLFGKEKVVESTFDLVDKAFYTDQEKSENKAAILRFYEPFKLAQRYVAMIFCPAYGFAWILTFLTELTFAMAERSIDLTKVYALLEGNMAVMVIIILSFYFGGGALEGAIERFKAKQK